MNIFNIQSLIAQKKTVNSGNIDAANSYLQVGVYQDGNRKNAASDANSYPPYAIPIEQVGGTVLETPLFQFFYGYWAVPTMIKTMSRIEGPSFFGNNVRLDGYKVAGKIAVDTSSTTTYYIGTLTANVPLTGDYPWKLSGQVEANFGSGVWMQSPIGGAALFTDLTNGGVAPCEFITVVEDYTFTPGEIDLYLVIQDNLGVGLAGNVSFEYDVFVEDNINLQFDNLLYP